MELTDKDRRIASHMRGQQVLANIHDQRVNCSEGLILITCSDGDRFYDIYTYSTGMVAAQRQSDDDARPRIHVFAWHGGPLRVATLPTPVESPERNTHLIDPFEEIEQARRMKKIDTIGLVPHAPCGWAYSKEWDIIRVMQGCIAAKANIKMMDQLARERDPNRTLPPVKVKMYPAIHWGPKSDNSYFLSRTAWSAYENYLRESRAY